MTKIIEEESSSLLLGLRENMTQPIFFQLRSVDRFSNISVFSYKQEFIFINCC